MPWADVCSIVVSKKGTLCGGHTEKLKLRRLKGAGEGEDADTLKTEMGTSGGQDKVLSQQAVAGLWRYGVLASGK